MTEFESLSELFANKKRWTSRSGALTKKRNSCTVKSSLAVCWCLSGGFCKIYEPQGEQVCWEKYRKLVKAGKTLYPKYIYDNPNWGRCFDLVKFNDEEGYDAVLKLVQIAGV